MKEEKGGRPGGRSVPNRFYQKTGALQGERKRWSEAGPSRGRRARFRHRMTDSESEPRSRTTKIRGGYSDASEKVFLKKALLIIINLKKWPRYTTTTE